MSFNNDLTDIFLIEWQRVVPVIVVWYETWNRQLGNPTVISAKADDKESHTI